MIYKLNCDWCHKEYNYKIQPSGIRRNKFHFCCLECQNKWNSQRMKNINPMKVPETAIKQSKALIKTYKSTDLRERLSISIKKGFENGRVNPNKGVYLSSLEDLNTYFKTLHSMFWKRRRMEILLRDGYTCQKCGKTGSHTDHIIPWRISKSNAQSNLQCLCKSCNSKKVSEDKKKYGG